MCAASLMSKARSWVHFCRIKKELLWLRRGDKCSLCGIISEASAKNGDAPSREGPDPVVAALRIGPTQRVFLRAMSSLADESGGKDDLFSARDIVARVFALSPELQAVERQREQAKAASARWWTQKADAGDALAQQYLACRTRAKHQRLNARKYPEWVDNTFNAPRVFAGLEARGLVRRAAPDGRASAGLTARGREVVAALAGSARPRL